jgi:hypothetical protein
MNKNKKDKIKRTPPPKLKRTFRIKPSKNYRVRKNVKGYSGKKKRGYFKLVVRQVHTQNDVVATQPRLGSVNKLEWLICSLERAFSLAFQGTGEVNVVFEMIW